MEEFLEILKTITQKDVFELTDYEKEFLRGRSSYLSEEEKAKFAEILEEPANDEKSETKKKGRIISPNP